MQEERYDGTTLVTSNVEIEQIMAAMINSDNKKVTVWRDKEDMQQDKDNFNYFISKKNGKWVKNKKPKNNLYVSNE